MRPRAARVGRDDRNRAPRRCVVRSDQATHAVVAAGNEVYLLDGALAESGRASLPMGVVASIGFTAGRYLIVAIDGDRVIGYRALADLTLEDTTPLEIASAAERRYSTAGFDVASSADAGSFVVFFDTFTPTAEQVWALAISSGGTIGPRHLLTSLEPLYFAFGTLAHAAALGGRHLLAFLAWTDMDRAQTLAVRTDATGLPLDATPFAIDDAPLPAFAGGSHWWGLDVSSDDDGFQVMSNVVIGTRPMGGRAA